MKSETSGFIVVKEAEGGAKLKKALANYYVLKRGDHFFCHILWLVGIKASFLAILVLFRNCNGPTHIWWYDTVIYFVAKSNTFINNDLSMSQFSRKIKKFIFRKQLLIDLLFSEKNWQH